MGIDHLGDTTPERNTIIKHDFDWDTAQPPWSWIGLQFRVECERLARGDLPNPPRLPREQVSGLRGSLTFARRP